MTIGIGLTTYNRYPVFKKTYEQLLKFLPDNSRVFIVDDCSDFVVPEASLRFETNMGIAAAKNACLSALDDCDFIFLLDDDTYPKIKDWHLPYINSGLNHAMMIFNRLSDGTSTNNRIIKNKDGLVWYQNPCGNMLFFSKKAIETVGGMDVGYGQWGGEHQGISERIYNNGLTPHPFIDVVDSTNLFYSHDYYQSCERSVPKEIRKQCIKRVLPKLKLEKNSKAFIPYRPMTGRIITTYFTGADDPQRGKKWESSIVDIVPLMESIAVNAPLTIINDSLYSMNTSPYKRNSVGCNVDIHYKSVRCLINPYLQRWVSILEYLKEVKEDYVFCVDATDVEMLNNPFKENLGNYLWVGDEPSTINNEWLIKHHNQPLFESFFKTHKNKPLLNAGVIGGRKCIVEAFLTRLVWYIQNHEILFSDMALFNYVLYTEFAEQVKHGRKVTNVFKSYNKCGDFWFAHK
jgi:glycosyltransferase involved in cell wall biosynthesis